MAEGYKSECGDAKALDLTFHRDRSNEQAQSAAAADIVCGAVKLDGGCIKQIAWSSSSIAPFLKVMTVLE